MDRPLATPRKERRHRCGARNGRLRSIRDGADCTPEDGFAPRPVPTFGTVALRWRRSGRSGHWRSARPSSPRCRRQCINRAATKVFLARSSQWNCLAAILRVSGLRDTVTIVALGHGVRGARFCTRCLPSPTLVPQKCLHVAQFGMIPMPHGATPVVTAR
jgi:hypothetical protein